MACVDIELCDKIDTLNTSVQSLILNQTNDNGALLSVFSDVYTWVQMFLFLTILWILYKSIVKYIF